MNNFPVLIRNIKTAMKISNNLSLHIGLTFITISIQDKDGFLFQSCKESDLPEFYAKGWIQEK